MTIEERRNEMHRMAWVKNVTRLYPGKATEEIEALSYKVFGADSGPISHGTPCSFDINNPDKVVPLHSETE